MWIPIVGILIGALLGLLLPIQTTNETGSLMALIILVCFYSLINIVKHSLGGTQKEKAFLTKFIVFLVVAIGFEVIGKKLNIPIYLVPIFYFGIKLFEDLGVVIDQIQRR